MSTSRTPIDIVGIGNAIVDLLAPATASDLAQWELVPGAMTLIDRDRADRMTEALTATGRARSASGGSAANTCVVAASLGASVAYLGTVAADPLGEAFRADIAAAGVAFPSRPTASGLPTGRCLVMVTEDGQRTMSTFLGAANAFSPDDLDRDLVASARITYLEGYLFDPPAAQAAFREAATTARDAGNRVAISLSDSFCVERHRDAFLDFLHGHADIVFANEAELLALTRSDWPTALQLLARDVALAAVTRGEHGSVILSGGEQIEVPAIPASVVDTTGAGDAYAAGFLAALAAGAPLPECGRRASEAAAAIIAHWGARPPPAATA